MADWKNPGDLEFCYVVVWAHTRCKVQNIKRQGDHAIITMLQPHFTNARIKEGVGVSRGEFGPDRMYIENALELLDEQGEWYLDRPAKTVYYMPRPGEDMAKVQVIPRFIQQKIIGSGTIEARL